MFIVIGDGGELFPAVQAHFHHPVGGGGVPLPQRQHQKGGNDAYKADRSRGDPKKCLALQLGQEPDQDHAHQCDDDVRPEPLLIFHELPEAQDALFVGGEDTQHRKGQDHHRRPPDAETELLPVLLQRNHRHQGHDQHRHIKPPGVIGRVEGGEGAIQKGDQRHHTADAEQPFRPVPPFGLEKRQYSGHGEQRQERRHRRPLGIGIREKVGVGRDVGGEEEAADDQAVALDVSVEDAAPAEKELGGAGVAEDRQQPRNQQCCGQQKTHHRFQRQQQEGPEA